jgi:hypothetical protein
MDKKTTGIIATVVTALLCGCPGLAGLCLGLIWTGVSFVPGANIDIGGSSDPKRALAMGIGSVCLGIVFIAIPVVVGVVMLRKKPSPEIVSNEPLPPAI